MGENFGAGTSGTTWGKLPVDAPPGNRGPTFEAVSVILISVAGLVLALRCASQVRLRKGTSIANLPQILRTYLHQEYQTGRPRGWSRRVARAHHLSTYYVFCHSCRLQLLITFQVVTAGVTADIIVGNKYGMGKHLSINTTPIQIVAILKVRSRPLLRFCIDKCQLTSHSWSTLS